MNVMAISRQVGDSERRMVATCGNMPGLHQIRPPIMGLRRMGQGLASLTGPKRN